jgi:small-conductance mechanosensitive channel
MDRHIAGNTIGENKVATRSWVGLIIIVVFHFLVLAQGLAQSVAARQPQSKEQAAGTQPAEETPTGIVEIEGRHILAVYEPVGGYTPEERAKRIAGRIIATAKSKVAVEDIRVEAREYWTEILAENELIMALTDIDAKKAGKPRAQLANEYAGNIRQTVITYRREHTWRALLWAILYTVLATLVLAGLGFALRRLRLIFRELSLRWLEGRTRVKEKSAFHLAVTYVGTTVVALGAIVRWTIMLALFEIYLTVVLSFFAATRSISMAVTQWLFSALSSLGVSALAYLPNLMVIAVIIFIGSQLLRLVNVVFTEVGRGSIKIIGFYPDWAEPTAKLVRILIVVLLLVIIFPYLPGSKSPAFQGISIFVGVLLSLGSSSAVANAIAGIILTYMRSFLVGDWVKIGDTMGEVVEKNMLVTRVLTMKKEIITIPNATVMGGSVTNYTLEAKKAGVIFHTTATIGYDAPWRTVHRLLIEAAQETKDVLHDPAPFVLQTALNDFYVAYELNAYTDKPLHMQFIYSELHQNIQDKFNEAGVEICSPHFSALRDGNTIAIPENYIAKDYETPGFRVDERKRGKAQAAGKE